MVPPSPSPTGSVAPDGRLRAEFRIHLRRHLWLVAASTILVALLVTFWTLRQPYIYEAVVSLEYNPNPAQPLRGHVDDLEDPITNYWATKEFYKTQNRILTSRTVAERVVQKLGLNRSADFFEIPEPHRATWRGASVADAAALLLSRTRVEQLPDTRLVELRVRDHDPQRAALIANTLADLYIEKTLEDRLETTVAAIDWLSRQLDELRRRLESSERALHRFKEDHNILSVSLEDRQNIVARSLEQVTDSLTRVATRRVELQSRVAQLRGVDPSDPMNVSAPVILASPEVQGLRTRYREKLAERNAMAVRYGSNHPQLRTLDSELATIRTSLEQVVRDLIRSAEADLAELRRTEAGLQMELARIHQTGLELNLREIEYAQLQRERENNANLYKVLLERTAETNLTKLARVPHARVLDRALVPSVPVAPRVAAHVAGGLVLGLLVGVLAAILRARLDQRIRTVEDVESLGLTVLGVLPHVNPSSSGGLRRLRRARFAEDRRGATIVHDRPHSAAAECVRTIRTNIAFMAAEEPIRSLVVTSPMPFEGKTTVAVNLAAALAQSGQRVLLVDADLRRPRLHRILDLPGTIGITSALIGEARLESVVRSTSVPNLVALPCGPIPPNPAELLHTDRFAQLLEQARREFDFVILDSPPLSAVVDAAVIAPRVHGALIVARSRRTLRTSLHSSVRQLRDVGARILGAVINDVDLRDHAYRDGRYAYYYYYDSDAYGSSRDSLPRAPDASPTPPVS